MILPRWILLRMRNVSDKTLRENQNTHFMFSNFFFRRSCRLWDNGEKYGTAGQATDDNTAHAHWMLDTLSYRHILRICNTYCLSTATTVARTPLNVMLCVHMNCAERINLQNSFINMYFLWPNFHYVLSWLSTVKVILFRVSNTWNWTQDGFWKKNIIYSYLCHILAGDAWRMKTKQPVKNKSYEAEGMNPCL